MEDIKSSDWPKVRNIDLANLFYYSLSFNNKELMFDTLKKWKEQYHEINSLFYTSYQSYSSNKSLGRFLVVHHLLKMHTFDFSRLNKGLLSKLQNEGLTIDGELSSVLFRSAIKNNDVDLLDYIIDYVSFSETNKWFANMISQSSHNKDVLDYLLLNDKAKTNREILIAHTLLYECAYKRNIFAQYLYDKKVLFETINLAQNMLEKNESVVVIKTKNGTIGEKKDVEKMLLTTKLYYDLEEDSNDKKNIEMKMKI